METCRYKKKKVLKNPVGSWILEMLTNIYEPLNDDEEKKGIRNQKYF